jgi:type II secretory pathway component PulJ
MEVRTDEKAFTLIEILMAVFIGLVLLGAIHVSMISGQRSSAGVERKVAAQQDVRAALEIMAMEVSMASFNSNLGPITWKTSSCADAALSEQPRKGIQEATPTSITVELDLDKNSEIGTNPGVSEILRYSYDAAQQRILREMNCAGAVSFLGDVSGAAQGTRTVRVINNTLGIPAVFRYYDGKNPATELLIDTTTNTNTNLIPEIRRIDIILDVETEEVDPGTQQRRQMTYSTSVLVRNHVLN